MDMDLPAHGKMQAHQPVVEMVLAPSSLGNNFMALKKTLPYRFHNALELLYSIYDEQLHANIWALRT